MLLKVQGFIDSLESKTCKWTIKNPLKSISLAVLISLFAGMGFLSMKSSYVTRVWFAPDNPEILKLNQFEKNFGNDQLMIVVYHNDKTTLNLDDLNILKELKNKMERYADISRVESIFNYPFITTTQDEIEVLSFIEEDDLNQEKVDLLKKRLVLDRTPLNQIISNDHTVAFLIGYLQPSFESEPNYKEIVEQAEFDVNTVKSRADGNFMLLGDATAAESFRRIGLHDQMVMLPIMAIFLFVLIRFFFRSSLLFFMSGFLGGVTSLFTLGMVGHLGYIYNSITAAIPAILIGICLADSIHIYNTLKVSLERGVPFDEALLYSLKHNWKPTFLTSLSTGLSFLSITFTEIIPIHDMGVLVAIGTFMAWINTYLIIGGSLSFFKARVSKLWSVDKKKRGIFSLKKEHVGAIKKWRWPIILVFTLSSIVCIQIASKSEVNSDPIKYFVKGHQFRDSYDFIVGKITGIRRSTFSIDSGLKDGVKNPAFLQNVSDFIDEVLKDKEMTSSRSLINLLTDMKKNIDKKKWLENPLPTHSKQAAELMFLYSLSAPAGQELKNWVTTDYKIMSLNFKWTLETTSESSAKIKKIIKMADKYNLNIEAVGNVPLYTKMNEMVVHSFFFSISLAIVMMGLLVLIVFKDFKMSLISMLPNIIPLAYGAATLVLLDKDVDIATSIVYAVCLGIAVDDTIHFISNYMRLKGSGLGTEKALEEIFETTGRALVATTVVLFFGFGVFYFAEFEPNKNFGLLCSIILSLALLTDLILLPAILLCLKDKTAEVKAK